MPAARQNRSKLAETSSQALPTAPTSVGAKAIDVVLTLFMALLSFRGISTPSLPAQGEQRRSSNFNIQRGNPQTQLIGRLVRDCAHFGQCNGWLVCCQPALRAIFCPSAGILEGFRHRYA